MALAELYAFRFSGYCALFSRIPYDFNLLLSSLTVSNLVFVCSNIVDIESGPCVAGMIPSLGDDLDVI